MPERIEASAFAQDPGRGVAGVIGDVGVAGDQGGDNGAVDQNKGSRFNRKKCEGFYTLSKIPELK
jgi:hypothetical protein